MRSSFSVSTCFPIEYLSFFFFNDTATTEIYTLSLHDALPLHLVEAVGRGDRHEHDLDLDAAELGRGVLHHLAAEVDRVADRLLHLVVEGERQRAFAIAELDRRRVLDGLQRAGERADRALLLLLRERGGAPAGAADQEPARNVRGAPHDAAA